MQGSKREYVFIKDDILRNVNVTFSNVQTFETLVHVAVSKKHAMGGLKFKFVRVGWSEIRLARTSKIPKTGVIRLGMQKCMKWCVIG
jgi:hypothetical protein